MSAGGSVAVRGAPWYRVPLVWLVVAIPASAVAMGAVLLVLSIRGFDGLVADDYYRRGMQINLSIERDRAAAARLLQGELAVDAGAGVVGLAITARDAVAAPPTLTLLLHHATRGDLDRTIVLRQLGPGRYVGDWGALEPGAWNLTLATADWRLVGRLHAPGGTAASLAPRGL